MLPLRELCEAAGEPENAFDDAVCDEWALYYLWVGNNVEETAECLHLCPIKLLTGYRVDKFGRVENTTAKDSLGLYWLPWLSAWSK